MLDFYHETRAHIEFGLIASDNSTLIELLLIRGKQLHPIG